MISRVGQLGQTKQEADNGGFFRNFISIWVPRKQISRQHLPSGHSPKIHFTPWNFGPSRKAQLLERAQNKSPQHCLAFRLRKVFTSPRFCCGSWRISDRLKPISRWRHVQAWFSRKNSKHSCLSAIRTLTSPKMRAWKVLKLVFPDHVATKAPISPHSSWSFHAWLDTPSVSSAFTTALPASLPIKLPHVGCD